MKKMTLFSRIMAFSLTLLFSVSGTAADQKRDLLKNRMDFYEVKESLVMDRKWMPYPEYADREGWDNLLKEDKDKYVKEGEGYLGYEYKMIPASAYLEFDRTGNAKLIETPYMQNKEALSRLMLAELAEGKGRFLDGIIDGVFALCYMTTWTCPSSDDAGGSRLAFQPYDAQVIDAEAAQLGNLLSRILYFFKDEFDRNDPEISRRLLQEIRTRIMDPFFADDSFEWSARRDNRKVELDNSVPFVNGNVLLTFMLLENDRDKLSQAVYYTMQSVDKYLNQLRNDGRCKGDPECWRVSSGRVLDYIELLSLTTGGKLDVGDDAFIRKMQKTYSQSSPDGRKMGMLLNL